tara:strand:+ start:869 stop:1465 length:597 start_codon:yes stop_codon:yes gene_type:complete
MINKEDFKQTAIDEIHPYAKNSRFHSEKQIKQIANSIETFGFNNPIQVDENAIILSGHGRLYAAQLLGLETVPVVTIIGLTEAEKKAYVIADNKLSLNSSWDDNMLEQEIESLKEEGFDLDLLGWDVLPDFAPDVDFSILEDNSEEDDKIEKMSSDVKKAIQIEFDHDDFPIAQEMVKEARDAGVYIGGLLIDALSSR